VPSPKKLRAAAKAVGALAFADDDESDDGCGTPTGIQLFPDSPKTEDWRLAAAIDY
jgi:hypothetical protein